MPKQQITPTDWCRGPAIERTMPKNGEKEVMRSGDDEGKRWRSRAGRRNNGPIMWEAKASILFVFVRHSPTGLGPHCCNCCTLACIGPSFGYTPAGQVRCHIVRFLFYLSLPLRVLDPSLSLVFIPTNCVKQKYQCLHSLRYETCCARTWSATVGLANMQTFELVERNEIQLWPDEAREILIVKPFCSFGSLWLDY